MAGISEKPLSNPTAAAKECQSLTLIQEDLYELLELSSKSSVAQEVKQLINEQYNEVKEPWLVYGLYDTFCITKSSKFLALLLDCRKDPHDRFLCDKISEDLKHKEKRANAFEVLGYIIRKQPSWLYNIPQHGVMKQWMKVLKTEDDIVVMLSGVLNLLAFLPTVPGNISSYLDDVFGIFSRLANWRYHLLKLRHFPEIQQIHLEVTLYAYFHRVYGMFPCNFLSYLRTHFSKEGSKDSKEVYFHVIRPIMSTVKMHPLLVTNTRDHEKSSDRWKRMEVHDIIVESSRISLLSQESAKEEELDYGDVLDTHDTPYSSPFINFPFPSISVGEQQQNTSQIMTVTSVSSTTTSTSCLGKNFVENKAIDQANKSNFISGRAATGIMTSAGNVTISSSTARHSSNSSKQTIIESPPETAIEATPETTPFVTPVKDDAFRFARPLPSNQVSRQLNMDSTSSARSPSLATKSSIHTSDSTAITASVKANYLITQNSAINTIKQESSTLPTTTPTSPLKDNSSFRFPELPHHFRGRTSTNALTPESERRDSLFDRTDLLNRISDLSTSHVGNDNVIIKTTQSSDTASETNKTVIDALQSEHMPELSAPLNEPGAEYSATNDSLVNVIQKDIQSLAQYRPSPVKFTNQRPEQFPVKPKPERIPPTHLHDAEKTDVSENQKHVLSLETLKDFTDFAKEEVSGIF